MHSLRKCGSVERGVFANFDLNVGVIREEAY